MGKKKDKDDKPEEKNEQDPLGYLSDEERDILEEVIESFPPEIRDRIRAGDGRVVMKKLDGVGSPIDIAMGMLTSAVTDQMQEALMGGRDPISDATQGAAVDLALAFHRTLQSFFQQGDIIFKAFIYGMAAHFDVSPKELLEGLAEHAPDTKPLMVSREEINPEMLEKKSDEVRRLNELFNMAPADEPVVANDDDDDTKEEN